MARVWRTYRWLALLAIVAVPAACASPEKEVTGRLSDTVLHLENGDSVELQATVSAVVEGSPPGRMVIFHPFTDFSDIPRLRQTAIALFHYLQPGIDSAPPPFVVLRATNLPAAQRKGFYNIENYGFVLERHADGKWYFLHESDPLPPPSNKRLTLAARLD